MLGPVHTAPFLYKNGQKNLRFCESVHTDLYKNATKTEVFENAIKSGYPQKRKFLKMHLINVNAQKTDIFGSVFVIRKINLNAQKRMFFPPFLYKNGVM